MMAGNHISASVDTPMREDAFDLDDETKIQLIEKHFSQIMNILGLDLNDDSLRDTPKRVAKMYVKEIFSGLNPAEKPSVTLFSNHYKYNQMLVEKNIAVYSNCEHHFVPITGKAPYCLYDRNIMICKTNPIIIYARVRNFRKNLQSNLQMKSKQL